MSFSRQIQLLISLLLLVALGGSFAVNVYHAREYLNRQLGTHAQDTASALGLALGPVLAQNDRAGMESMVTAIADRGYYQRVAVLDNRGGVLIERQTKIAVADVPSWFVRWLPLQTPTRTALVMQGWRQSGQVLVSSHPGYAYRQLWADAQTQFWWFGAAWLAALALVMALVRVALAPLSAMEQQAQAISGGQFRLLARIPWTRELRQVALALNRMSGQVERMLSEKLQAVQRLEQEANLDPLTGLFNRAFFEDRLRALLQDEEEFASGSLLLLRLSGVPDINARWGFSAGDDLLRRAAQLLGARASAAQPAMAARIGGVELALLIQEQAPEEALALADQLLATLAELRSESGMALPAAHIGIGIRCAVIDTPAKLLAQADMALRVAQSTGKFARFMCRQEARAQVVHGAAAWRRLLEQALQTNSLVLHQQPVFDAESMAILYHELLARIADDEGRLITAGVFMPIAQRTGLAQDYDKLIIRNALSSLPPGAARYALNLSQDAILDASFAVWLRRTLLKQPQQAERILIEFPEQMAVEHPEQLAHLIDSLASTGCRFGFDHVGVTPDALVRIRHFQPWVIKADGSLIQGLNDHPAKRTLLQMMQALARELDCLFVVSGVETREQLEQLREMKVSALQGRVLAAPSAL